MLTVDFLVAKLERKMMRPPMGGESAGVCGVDHWAKRKRREKQGDEYEGTDRRADAKGRLEKALTIAHDLRGALAEEQRTLDV